MPAQKKTVSSLFTAALGTLGFSALAGMLVTVMVAPAIAVTGMTASNSIGIFESLPNYIELGNQRLQNKIMLLNPDGNWQQIAVLYDQNREEITLDQMSPYLVHAAIAGEDRRFYDHGGVDLQSTIRAVIGQASGSSDSGGASTITMQTVRNIKVQEAVNNDTLTPEEKKAAAEEAIEFSFSRKLLEMKLAISLEKQYTKDQILQGYLNIAGFGGDTYGVAAATVKYFNVGAADVSPAQAASIIAMVQNPVKLSLDSPDNYARNQARRDKILGDMLEEKYITQEEHDTAVAIPVDAAYVNIKKPQQGCRYASEYFRLFCDYVVKSVPEMQQLGTTAQERRDNWKTGGYTVYGTLNWNAQVTARDIVRQYANPGETRFKLGAAVATVQPGTGAILTMAQNKDFDDGLSVADPALTALNLTADVRHGGSKGFQPGSTYKPFVLLAYLNAGNGINQTFNAGLLTFNLNKFKDRCNGPYAGSQKFRNDQGENGSYTVSRGTAASINSVFLQMATKLDQCDIRDVAASLGVHKAGDTKGDAELDSNPACAIGGCANDVSPLMMAGAYAAIGANGVFCKPFAVANVIDRAGTELGPQDAECKQTIDPGVAAAAASAMAGVMKGTASASNPNDGTAYIGKTGTTNESLHTWMVGTSTAAATAVWVGNIEGKQALRRISIPGGSAATARHRIFRPIARVIDSMYPGAAFPKPPANLLSGKPTIVPDVIGLTVEKAAPLLDAADLQLADQGAVDSDQPVGTIVRTDPGVGSSLSRGTTVNVVTSNGQGKAVPDVSGGKNLSFNDARNQLVAAGFTSVSEGCQPGALPTDPSFQKVVAQTPAPGTMGNPNTPIELAVARVNC